MDIEKLKLLAKLGMLEVFQSYLEDDGMYYYKEDENINDDFFKEEEN